MAAEISVPHQKSRKLTAEFADELVTPTALLHSSLVVLLDLLVRERTTLVGVHRVEQEVDVLRSELSGPSRRVLERREAEERLRSPQLRFDTCNSSRAKGFSKKAGNFK